MSCPLFESDGFFLFCFFRVFLVPGVGLGIFFFSLILVSWDRFGIRVRFLGSTLLRIRNITLNGLMDLDFWDGEVCLHQQSN